MGPLCPWRVSVARSDLESPETLTVAASTWENAVFYHRNIGSCGDLTMETILGFLGGFLGVI
jgi:hypothetical protein